MLVPYAVRAPVVMMVLLEDSRQVHTARVLLPVILVLALPQLALQDLLLTRVFPKDLLTGLDTIISKTLPLSHSGRIVFSLVVRRLHLKYNYISY